MLAVLHNLISKVKQWLHPARNFSIRVKLSDYPSGQRPFVTLTSADYCVTARVNDEGGYRFENLKPNVEYAIAPLAVAGKSWVPANGVFVLTPENPTAVFESHDPTARPNPWLSVAASATNHRH